MFPYPEKTSPRRPRPRDVGLLWMFLAIAAIPIVGVIVIGAWGQDELGVAAAVAVAALVGLAHEYGLGRRRFRRD